MGGNGRRLRGGDRVPVLGARQGAWKAGELGAVDMVAHALIPKLWMWLYNGALCEHPYALVNGCQLPLGTVKCNQLPRLTMKGGHQHTSRRF